MATMRHCCSMFTIIDCFYVCIDCSAFIERVYFCSGALGREVSLGCRYFRCIIMHSVCDNLFVGREVRLMIRVTESPVKRLESSSFLILFCWHVAEFASEFFCRVSLSVRVNILKFICIWCRFTCAFNIMHGNLMLITCKSPSNITLVVALI